MLTIELRDGEIVLRPNARLNELSPFARSSFYRRAILEILRERVMIVTRDQFAGLLGEQELRVLELTLRGLTAVEVAETMGVSPRTVESHRDRIKLKTGIKSHLDYAYTAALRDLEGAANA